MRLTAFFLLLVSAHAAAQDIVYPAGAGAVDVTKAPYHAKGDGKTDDTAAIQKALDDHPNAGAIIYLPRGTYVISATLLWPKGDRGGMEHKNTILEGASREHSILKLADNCPGFDDPNSPRALLWTGQKPAQRFRNAVRHLTVDSGVGNRGAIGMQFMANNQGTVRDVTIRSGDGAGPIGLDLGYTGENGPCLIDNVAVNGFDVGIRCGHVVNSITMENVVLRGQRECGIRNLGQVLNVRKLSAELEVPAIHNQKGPSFLTLVEATLTGRGKASEHAAIVNEAPLFARHVKASGYRRVLDNSAGDKRMHDGLTIDEFTHHTPLSLFPSARASLGLPIEETPEVVSDPPEKWVSVASFGAGGNTYQKRDRNDDTPAFQKAIDSGATTVYVPRGFYVLHDTVQIRGKVRRIMFMESQLVGGTGFKDSAKPAFRFEDGTEKVVLLERFKETYGSQAKVWLEHACKRTLVIRNSLLGRYESVGGGRLFLHDVCGGPFTFRQQHVWARQLNQETEGTHVVNDGGTLWILGYKTERGGTLLESKNGGRTEVLGCFAYATTGVSKAPMFVSTESEFSATMGEAHFGGHFPVLVRETRGGVTRELDRKDAQSRYGIGALLPLYVGRAEKAR